MKDEQFAVHAELEERHWWFVARRNIIQGLALRLMHPSKDKLVLDVGSGTGADIHSFSTQFSCVGIDISDVAIRFARLRFPEVQFICGDASRILCDFREKVDMALSLDVLEHVADDRGMMREMVQTLKPGGYLLVTVPADMALWGPQDMGYGHYRRYGVPQFWGLWEELPVEPLLVSHFNVLLYPPIRIIRSYNRWRERSSGRKGTDLFLPNALVNRALTRIFTLEAGRLNRFLAKRDLKGFRFGVSLLAVLRRL